MKRAFPLWLDDWHGCNIFINGGLLKPHIVHCVSALRPHRGSLRAPVRSIDISSRPVFLSEHHQILRFSGNEQSYFCSCPMELELPLTPKNEREYVPALGRPSDRLKMRTAMTSTAKASVPAFIFLKNARATINRKSNKETMSIETISNVENQSRNLLWPTILKIKLKTVNRVSIICHRRDRSSIHRTGQNTAKSKL